ncbi:MAG TPA: DoxX family protein [Burkholderiales bacterium]|nr:DoxX family protein [Burkholderiales bacterium]
MKLFDESARLSGKSEDVLLLLGRVALGLIFVKSGLQKLMALGPFAASLASRGIPSSGTWALIGATVEFVGGVLIVTGFRARAGSLLILLFTVVATLIAHRFWEFAEAARRTQESQFFKNLSIIGGCLLLFVTGGGRYSIDGLIRRRKQR